MKHVRFKGIVTLITVIAIVFQVPMNAAASQPSFILPPKALNSQPSSYYLLYQNTYLEYAAKLRDEAQKLISEYIAEAPTQRLIREFRWEAQYARDAEALTEIYYDKSNILFEFFLSKSEVLADIFIEGFFELRYRLEGYTRLVEHEKWQERLNSVYQEVISLIYAAHETEASKIDDVYMEEALKFTRPRIHF